MQLCSIHTALPMQTEDQWPNTMQCAVRDAVHVFMLLVTPHRRFR